MKSIKVLIVEDELLIAETIKLYLTERGHEAVGIAISYEEAVEQIGKTQPDIILLDIRLYGEKSGIDVAGYLQSIRSPIPFVIVSSQYDSDYIQKAMECNASGYITKPIAKETLWSTIELAVLLSKENSENKQFIDLKVSHGIQRILLQEILFIKSEHVYIEVVCTSTKYLARYTFDKVLEMINHPRFLRCHRSYIINVDKIQKYNSSKVWIEQQEIPVSAKYKDSLQTVLQE